MIVSSQFEIGATSVLRFLVESYKINPNAIYDISGVCKDSNVDPIEVSVYLFNRGLIRESGKMQPPHSVYCAITFEGVEESDNAFANEKYQDVIEGLGKKGGGGNVTEFLETTKVEYQIALDVAYALKNKGYVNIEMERFTENLVQVSFTSFGKELYDSEGPKFVNG